MKGSFLYATIIAGIAAMLVLSVLPAMAAPSGSISNLFPPGNNGKSNGVGMIDGNDGKKYVFQTPHDNHNLVLEKGQAVTFEPGPGRTATNVAPVDCPHTDPACGSG